MKKYFLETNRLYLREMTPDDFDEIAQMLENPLVVYAWEKAFKDIDIKNWISKNMDLYKKYSLGYFLMCDKNSNAVLGQAALKPDQIDSEDIYEIGYMLKPEYRGKGYAYESAKALIEHSFIKLGIEEVVLEIKPDNLPSIKVAEALGAKLSGSFDKVVLNKIMKHLIFKININSYPAKQF